MDRGTYERALHLWPEWRHSIEKSRLELGYDASWPVREAVDWIEANYSNRILPLTLAELKGLNLPSNLRTYWEDCFYCDFVREDVGVDFGKIRRRIAYEEVDRNRNPTGRWLPGNKSLPALPYEAGLIWYPDEDIHDLQVRIEVMLFSSLASRDLLKSAMDQIWQTLNHARRTGQWQEHPLSALIPKAKVNRSELIREALERYGRGEVDFEGLLVEEWETPDIQEQLRALFDPPIGTGFERVKKHRDLQKKVYDRVRKRLPYPKPLGSVKGQWRESLPLPRGDAGGQSLPEVSPDRDSP